MNPLAQWLEEAERFKDVRDACGEHFFDVLTFALGRLAAVAGPERADEFCSCFCRAVLLLNASEHAKDEAAAVVDHLAAIFDAKAGK